jgi:hypothetical protein
MPKASILLTLAQRTQLPSAVVVAVLGIMPQGAMAAQLVLDH